MAQAQNPDFVGIDTLKSIAKQYDQKIGLSAVSYRPDIFSRFGIKVLDGIQNMNIKYVLMRKGHVTERKVVGNLHTSSIGYLDERPLKVNLTVAKFIDNRDRYRELPQPVGPVAGQGNDSAKFTYPLINLAIDSILKTYGGDLFDCLFHGDASIPEVAEGQAKPANYYLRLYDGLITNINKDVAAGLISVKNGNLYEAGTIEAPADPQTDDLAYQEFKKFRLAWNPALRNAVKVLVWANDETGEAISDAYSVSKAHHKDVIWLDNGNYRFPQWKNIEVCMDASYGKGQKLVATVPDNAQYGIDTTGSNSFIGVKEGSDNDMLDIQFQIQSAVGTRIENVSPTLFCCTTASLTPVELAADYYQDLIEVRANDTAKGGVTVNGEAAPVGGKEYAAGTVLTLKAEAKEEAKFVGWTGSINSTEAEITLTVGYQPMSITAMFK